MKEERQILGETIIQKNFTTSWFSRLNPLNLFFGSNNKKPDPAIIVEQFNGHLNPNLDNGQGNQNLNPNLDENTLNDENSSDSEELLIPDEELSTLNFVYSTTGDNKDMSDDILTPDDILTEELDISA